MNTAADLQPTLPTGLPDGWLFDHDLPCPTCGYNLRMLGTPRCPECGTVFRWQTLLHVACPRCDESLETVDGGHCPNCNLALDWQAILDQADPSQFKHFEYTRRPIRAALRTWFAVLRPRRFWQHLRLESPPAVARLRRLRTAAIAIYLFGGLATLSVAADLIAWKFDSGWYAFYGALLLPPLLTSFGLPLFVPTLASFRIRRDQLLRCFSYGSLGLAWIGVTILISRLIMVIVNHYWPRTWTIGGGTRFSPRIYFAPTYIGRYSSLSSWLWRAPADCFFNVGIIATTLCFGLTWWWIFLWRALHNYLRLDHPNVRALFLSTQLICGLLFILILTRYTSFGMLFGSILNTFTN